MGAPPPSNTVIIRPIYRVPELGEYAQLENGAVINAGGVAGPNFTVGGKGLLFSDGTSTDGSTVTSIHVDVQAAYENSVGEAFIDFTSGKDFVLQAVNKKQFRFNADTGNVTISGNLTVVGDASTTINAAVSSDRVAIHQTAGSYTPFIIEPRGGITPSVNVADIKIAAGGASVFTISAAGTTYIQTLQTGLINGIDITALRDQINSVAGADTSAVGLVRAELEAHTSLTDDTVKHTAKQISVDTSALPNISGTNVQQAIESISTAISNVISTGIRGYEHIQQTVSSTWTVKHNGNTKRIQLTIWDNADEAVFADTRILDNNTVLISFNPPLSGRAILMFF